MRKINAVLGIALTVLLLIHGISGAFQLLDVIAGGNTIRKVLSWLMAAVLFLHVIIGVILTIRTLKTEKKSKWVGYPAENRLFWLRRISGFSILVFAVYHVVLFTGPAGKVFRLSMFGAFQLAGSLLLVLSVAVHLLSNIRPLMISFGAVKSRKFLIDFLLVLSVVLLLFSFAFIVYYLRWNVLWKQ